jgi:hypothetical protein
VFVIVFVSFGKFGLGYFVAFLEFLSLVSWLSSFSGKHEQNSRLSNEIFAEYEEVLCREKFGIDPAKRIVHRA